MGKIWMSGGGNGGDGSDDCTLTLADVPRGLTAVTADSDDDAAAGTLDAAASAADSHVLEGESYMKFNQTSGHWEKRKGNLSNNGAVNFALNCGESKQIPGGFTTGGTVKANGLAGQTFGTATAAQILAGQSAWVNGNRVDGTMPNCGGYYGYGNNKGVDAKNQRMWVQVPGGCYDENAQIFLSWADIRNLTGLTPDKIKKGQSVMGMIGNFEGYVTSPLYLYSYGAFGGGQTGVSHGGDAAPKGDYIECWGKDDWVKFNDIVSPAGYKFLNVVGHHTNIEWDDGTVYLNNLSGKRLCEATICNSATAVTTKLAVGNISEPCRLGFYGNPWRDNKGRQHYSLIWVYQVYLSVT